MSQDEGALRHRDAGDLERGDEKDAYFWKTVLLKRMLVFERKIKWCPCPFSHGRNGRQQPRPAVLKPYWAPESNSNHQNQAPGRAALYA